MSVYRVEATPLEGPVAWYIIGPAPCAATYTDKEHADIDCAWANRVHAAGQSSAAGLAEAVRKLHAQYESDHCPGGGEFMRLMDAAANQLAAFDKESKRG